MKDDCKVSVICITYNHAMFIRRTLEGFISQKTDFQFEVIVHDDASTDGTTDIVREYYNKYPEIIVAMFEDKNQYSQGKFRDVRKKMTEMVRGEYIAWCEGDDYWIDPFKLQKQVDYLESNKEYSFCVSHVRYHDLYTKTDSLIPSDPSDRDYSTEEIIIGGAIFQLSGIVMRADIYKQMPTCFRAKGFGDIQIYLYGALSGKCHVLSDVMSQYNHGVDGSFTDRMMSADVEKRIIHQTQYYSMLERVNEYYNYAYNDAFKYAIDRIKFSIAVLNKDYESAKQYSVFWKAYKKQVIRDRIANYMPWARVAKRKLIYLLNSRKKLLFK